LQLSLEEFNTFIERLLSPEIELLTLIDDHFITAPKILETYSQVAAERKAAINRKNKKFGEQQESSGEHSEKVKESKVKETKENESSSKAALTDDYFFSLPIDSDTLLLPTVAEILGHFFGPIEHTTTQTFAKLYDDRRFKPSTVHRIFVQACIDSCLLPAAKRNLKYLYKVVIGRKQDYYDQYLARKKKGEPR
jgi:hypothetical protein